MNTDTKQQRYADMMLIFTTPHDVEGAVLALHAGGFGAKVHPEIYVGDSDATRFVHVWQPPTSWATTTCPELRRRSTPSRTRSPASPRRSAAAPATQSSSPTT